MTLPTTRSCAHQSCACPAGPREGPHRGGPDTPAPSEYCGAYCANVDRSEPEDGACACGHAACEEGQLVEIEPDDVGVSLGRGPGSRDAKVGDNEG